MRDKPSAQLSAGREMARGGVWMVTMRWVMRGIGLISTLILVRLLDASDFGIIAMSMIVVGLLEVLAQSGVDLALIRTDDPQREDYDSAWTLQLLISVFIGILLFLSAPLVANLFDEERLTTVIRALSFRSIMVGFENIGTIEFRRSFNFAKEFRFNVFKKLFGFFITIGLAVWLRSYWALVISTVAAQIVNVAYSYAIHDFRPRFHLARIPSLLSFSSWLVVQRLSRYFAMRIDQFVVGAFAGTQFMGRYSVAYDIATSPTGEIVTPMARGLYPVYARLQSDPIKLVESYLSSLSAITLIILPLGFGLWATAHVAVPVLLGDKWASITPLVEMLALFGVFYEIGNTVQALLIAMGRVRFLAILSIWRVIFFGTALYITAKFISVDQIATTRALMAVIVLPLTFSMLMRVSYLRPGPLLQTLWPRFAAVLFMIAVIKVSEPSTWTALPVLLFDVCIGAGSYIFAVYALWFLMGRPKGPEGSALHFISRRIPRSHENQRRINPGDT